MSGRRVARVDAGLLSLTHRGPFTYVRYHFSRRRSLALRPPLAGLSRGVRATVLTFPLPLFFRRVSLPHARAHTRATNTRAHSTRARARTRVHTLSRTRGSQAHAPNTREIGRGRTHARAHGNDRSLYPSRFNPPSAATFLLPRSYVLLRYLHHHHHHYYHHLPLFTLAHSFFPFYFSPSLSFDPPSPSPSHRRRWCLSLHPLDVPDVRRLTLGATRPARRVARW